MDRPVVCRESIDGLAKALGPVSMPGPGLCRRPAVSERDASDLADRRTASAAGHPERLVLDLSGLAFVDVAGARALDKTCKLLQAECPVIFRTPRPSTCTVCNLTGLAGPS